MPFPSTARERSLAFNESLRTGTPLYPDLDLETLGIDPAAPCTDEPGSEGKILMLQARYQIGLPGLWHPDDAGFGETDLYRNFFMSSGGCVSEPEHDSEPEEPPDYDEDDGDE